MVQIIRLICNASKFEGKVMKSQISIGYKALRDLAFLLTHEDKKKLILELQKSLETPKKREFGKYDGQVWMSDDFNEPLEDFKEYMP